MRDTEDETLTGLNEMLQNTPGVPPSMEVQPRNDQYYLEIQHHGWSPTLHAWTQEETVDLMANARALASSPAELKLMDTAIVDGDAAVYYKLAMVTVERILEEQATFARAGALLGMSSPASQDDLRHVRVDRHTAMMINGFGDDASTAIPEALKMILEMKCGVDAISLENTRTGQGANFEIGMELAWIAGMPVPLVTMLMPVSACKRDVEFDGCRLEMPDIQLPATIENGIIGRTLGAIVETKTCLDDRLITSFSRTRHNLHTVIELALVPEPIEIGDASPAVVGATAPWGQQPVG